MRCGGMGRSTGRSATQLKMALARQTAQTGRSRKSDPTERSDANPEVSRSAPGQENVGLVST